MVCMVWYECIGDDIAECICGDIVLEFNKTLSVYQYFFMVLRHVHNQVTNLIIDFVIKT